MNRKENLMGSKQWGLTQTSVVLTRLSEKLDHLLLDMVYVIVEMKADGVGDSVGHHAKELFLVKVNTFHAAAADTLIVATVLSTDQPSRRRHQESAKRGGSVSTGQSLRVKFPCTFECKPKLFQYNPVFS